jgi:hypothetical protein
MLQSAEHAIYMGRSHPHCTRRLCCKPSKLLYLLRSGNGK